MRFATLVILTFALAALLPTVAAETPTAADTRLATLTATGVACADGLGVPCGYIYPVILMDLEGGNDPRPLTASAPLSIPTKLHFIFDPCSEGAGTPDAGKPIVVQFEFPRRPRWVEMSVEPAEVEIVILPQYITPPDDPAVLSCQYRYTTDITINARLIPGETPVLRDGLAYAKLMTFAKSTESGLYKSAYGIKELKVVPDKFVYESSLATGPAIAYIESLPQTLDTMTRTTLDTTVTLTPPKEIELWRAAAFKIEASKPAILEVTVIDEAGRIVHNSGPMWSAPGATTTRAAFNHTFYEPGRHTILIHATPLLGGPAFLSSTVAYPILVGPFAPDSALSDPRFPDGVRYPRDYRARIHEVVTEIAGNKDPSTATFQYEKFIPFLVGENANAIDLQLQLSTDNAAAQQTDRGLANLLIQVVDADGQIIQQGTLDFANPTKRIPVSAVPSSGLFHLRVVGVGLAAQSLAGATYSGSLSVIYDERPIMRVTADGIPDHLDDAHDATFGDFTLILAQGAPAAWSTDTLAVTVKRANATLASAVNYAVTVSDHAGETVYASGLRTGPPDTLTAAWTPPMVGLYTVTVRVAPAGMTGSEDFQAFSAAFTRVVGDASARTVLLPAALKFEDAGVSAARGTGVPLAMQRIVIHDGATKVTTRAAGATAVILDESGATVTQATTPGVYYVIARGLDTSPGTFSFSGEAEYPDTRHVDNPAPMNLGGKSEDILPADTPAPAAILLVLLLAGVALARRRV